MHICAMGTATWVTAMPAERDKEQSALRGAALGRCFVFISLLRNAYGKFSCELVGSLASDNAARIVRVAFYVVHGWERWQRWAIARRRWLTQQAGGGCVYQIRALLMELSGKIVLTPEMGPRGCNREV